MLGWWTSFGVSAFLLFTWQKRQCCRTWWTLGTRRNVKTPFPQKWDVELMSVWSRNWRAVSITQCRKA